MYLSQMLHRALQQRPDRPMTICGDRVHTTTEVVDRVARLAGALRGLGIGEGDRVGMLSLNSDRYYEFLFASWWTGAVAHPINTRWSSTEINYALDDSGTDVLLVDDTFASTMAELPGVETVVYCGDGPTPSGMLDYEEMIDTATPVEDLRHGNDAVAALLYTGGTTGFPKRDDHPPWAEHLRDRHSSRLRELRTRWHHAGSDPDVPRRGAGRLLVADVDRWHRRTGPPVRGRRDPAHDPRVLGDDNHVAADHDPDAV